MSEQQPKEARGDGGRVVYSRLPSEAETHAAEQSPPPAHTTVLPAFVHEPLAPTLPTLLVAFVLLALLVFGLGYQSLKAVRAVSEEVQRLDHQLADRSQLLLATRAALTQLDNEARERGAREASGGFVNPFNANLSHARNDAKKQMFLFEHLPVAQTEQGRAFREAVAKYIESTNDAEQYSLEGYKNFRPVEAGMNAFLADINRQQGELERQRLILSEQAAHKIRLLTTLGVLASALIAAATIWEVQRRFRQMRRSLTESRRERQFSSQM
ncbi:MAG TPA: hypothetical protein VJT82_09820, partial [Pyrinomonadaceae bacterium]|nr:hypothetical protein [Pyrinomonadaceae bacterium]